MFVFEWVKIIENNKCFEGKIGEIQQINYKEISPLT
jgi:hypothetical protein